VLSHAGRRWTANIWELGEAYVHAVLVYFGRTWSRHCSYLSFRSVPYGRFRTGAGYYHLYQHLCGTSISKINDMKVHTSSSERRKIVVE